jgi:hypothetical protein
MERQVFYRKSGFPYSASNRDNRDDHPDYDGVDFETAMARGVSSVFVLQQIQQQRTAVVKAIGEEVLVQ